MDENLISMKKLQNDIKSMKLLGLFIDSEQRKKLKTMEQKLSYMEKQIELFNSRFSDNGWCAYDSISFSLLEEANETYDNEGLDKAEIVLLDYYKNEVKKIIHWLKANLNEFMIRYDLIQKAFDDHFTGRYYSSIPLFLIIIDGAVNDFTRSKGFFAEGTDVTAWDCVVGCSDGLGKLKAIFNQGRNKTNTEEIFMPYRNGILHGRDLNYANEYVSCKCIALIFAISDWMEMKNSELQRKEKLEKEMNPPSIIESISTITKNDKDKKEIENWKPRTIIVGTTIKAYGEKNDYLDYPYLLTIYDMFEAWKNKNFGRLSILLKNMFYGEKSDNKRAGECREFFQNKDFESFEFKEVEERACALSRVLVKAKWRVNEKQFNELLEFGCVYENNNEGEIVLPWRDNGEWIIIPWKVQGIYKL